MNAQIDHLLHHPEHIRLVAGWIYHEFWEGKAGYTVETFEGRPAGTVNLIHNDDPARPQLHEQVTDTFCIMRVPLAG